jgi:hypothetical protein
MAAEGNAAFAAMAQQLVDAIEAPQYLLTTGFATLYHASFRNNPNAFIRGDRILHFLTFQERYHS